MGTKSAGSSFLWIGVAVLVAGYALWLTAQLDDARAHASAAQQREQQLVRQVQQLAAQVAQPRAAGTESSASADELAVALLRRPDLIPFPAEVGGTFYFLEDTVDVLSDRYVYATAEDGHVMAHLLLAYERDGDGIEFEVIDAYRP